MTILRSEGSGESTGFYNDVITSSCKFDGSTSNLVSPSFSSDLGNTWTWSAWVKFTNQTSDRRGSLFNVVGQNASLYFDNTSQDFLSVNDDGAAVRSTSVLLRDPSNWYHIVLNGNGTLNKLWINGVLATFGTDPNLDQINSAAAHQIGGSAFGTNYFFDGIMADINFVSETALDYTAFAETKNGVLIPKEPNVTYGANGFRLQFKQTGTGTDANGIGADTSGNDSHFTVNGLDSSDVLSDSPENNLATWNPLIYRRSNNFVAVFSEGNTKVNGTSSQVAHTSSTIASTGKHYAEFYINNASKAVTSCGVVRTLWDGGLGQSYASNYGGAYYSTNGTRAYNATSDSQTAPGSDRVGIEVDFANNEVEFFTVASNGTRTSRGGKLTSSNGIEFNGEGVFTATTHDVSSSYIEAYFSESSWHGTPNSGYEELSASKLPDVTMGGNNATQPTDHFNTVRYDGANNASQSITDVGFKPDWLWVKSTSTTSDHYLYDSTRNADAIASLTSNKTTHEDSTSGQFTQFTATGFDLPADSAGYINYTGRSYKAWCWKANGGITTTNDASETSVGTIDSVFQANDTSGFSIVTYTGTGTAGTVKHGLSVAPSLVIIKSRTTASPANWVIGQDAIGFTGQNYFTDIGAFSPNSGSFNNTAPTTSVVSIGSDNTVNQSTATYVMYCFANVDGFSRIGSYEMNARVDGPFIYTGFRPAWLLTRPVDQNGNWSIYDSVSDPFNDGDSNMAFAGGTTAESGFGTSAMDLLSNGFKIRHYSAGYSNIASNTAIYMAFAEQPFKFSNAR